jgi:hypothetical protein
MASLQLGNGSYRVMFRFADQTHTFTVGKVNVKDASAAKSRVEYLLRLLDQRVMTLPEGMDVVEFMRHDGKPPETPEPEKKKATFEEVRSAYLVTFGDGALEHNTLATIRIHFRHLAENLGDGFSLGDISLSDLQKHVDRRRSKVAPVTIKKEIATLRSAWNWAASMGHISGTYPAGKLVTVSRTPVSFLSSGGSAREGKGSRNYQERGEGSRRSITRRGLRWLGVGGRPTHPAARSPTDRRSDSPTLASGPSRRAGRRTGRSSSACNWP